jgi:hypothetical protein
MKRELCKFLAGAVAGLAYAHVGYAVAVSRGMLNEPIFLGRKWKTEYLWAEAGAYSVVSLRLAYCGWISKPQEQLQKPTTSATDGQSKQPVGAGEQSQHVSR